MTYMFASQTSSYAANNGHMFYQYNQMNNDYISQKDIYYTLRHRTLKWVGKFNNHVLGCNNTVFKLGNPSPCHKILNLTLLDIY